VRAADNPGCKRHRCRDCCRCSRAASPDRRDPCPGCRPRGRCTGHCRCRPPPRCRTCRCCTCRSYRRSLSVQAFASFGT
jgi:hypothetical protein